MLVINFLIAAALGALAHLAGADWPVVAVVVWAAHRVEAALSNQMSSLKLLTLLVHAEARKVDAEVAQREAHIAHIARNN